MDDASSATTSGKVKTKSTVQRQVPYPTNLLHRIFDRENNNFNRNKFVTHAKMLMLDMTPELEMFKCFPPNFTIQNVDKPLGYMRKFTPDGKVLLSFSHDQRSLEVYEYRGVGAMADLLVGQTSECITAADHSQQSLCIRQLAFERMFVLRRSIRMKYGMSGGYLNREFSVFLEDSRFVLIASMGMAHIMPDVRDPYNYPDLYNDCDHFFYNFYLIDLLADYISDCVTYKYDSIQLSHNHGVSCIGNRVAIYSKYRQCIDLYEVDDGCLKKMYTIGPWGAHMRVPCELLVSNDDFRPQYTRPLSHFKQRIITHLYQCAINEKDLKKRNQKIQEFYKNFSKYERMVIAKMQLMSPNLLLLRYEQHPQQFEGIVYPRQDQSVGNESEDVNPLKLYVFYRIQSEKVLRIYEGTSNELLHILRDFTDNFRNVYSYQTGRRPSASGNNVFLQASFNETISMLSDPTQRLNPTLPISSQSFTPSPYLDVNQFVYDDRQISALERPRISSMETLVFRDRVTNRCLFRMILEPDDGQYYFDSTEDRFGLRTRRELVAFIFHPYEPFVISVQKLSQRYVVNFHTYNKSTIVSQSES